MTDKVSNIGSGGAINFKVQQATEGKLTRIVKTIFETIGRLFSCFTNGFSTLFSSKQFENINADLSTHAIELDPPSSVENDAPAAGEAALKSPAAAVQKNTKKISAMETISNLVLSILPFKPESNAAARIREGFLSGPEVKMGFPGIFQADLKTNSEAPAKEAAVLNNLLVRQMVNIGHPGLQEMLSQFEPFMAQNVMMNWNGTDLNLEPQGNISGSIMLANPIGLAQDLGKLPSLFENEIAKNLLSQDLIALWNGQSGEASASFTLPGNVGCNVYVSLPVTASEEQVAALKMHPFIKNLLSSQLQGQVPAGYDVDKILQLLFTLPTQTTSIDWQGSKGLAELTIQLPGGGKVALGLTLPKEAEKPDFIRQMMGKFLPPEIFNGIKPLLSQDFSFTWKGADSTFELKFKQQLKVKINQLQLKLTGFFGWIAETVAKDSFVKLPKMIRGKIDLENLSVQFTEKAMFSLGVGVLRKNLALYGIQYDSEKNSAIVVRGGIVNHANKKTEVIDLNESTVDTVNFEIQPVVSKKKAIQPVAANGAAEPAKKNSFIKKLFA